MIVYFVVSVHKYHVVVFSGDGKADNTEAKIYVRLVGKNGDSGSRQLIVSDERSKRLDGGKQVGHFSFGKIRLF